MNATNKSSGDLGVSATTLNDGKAILVGVNLHAAAADVVITIYDNTAASGKILFKYTLDINVVGLARYIDLPDIRADNGLHVVVTGVGAIAIVHYR